MAEDITLRLRRIQGHAAKLEANHAQVDEMMLLRIADGLGAMRYGQYGGSFPDPTAQTVFDVNGPPKEPVRWRDHRPEDDRQAYYDKIIAAEKLLEEADTIRQRNMSANNNIRDRLDPTDWCRIHFQLHLYEGFRRRAAGGDLCSTCYGFQYGTKEWAAAGREPTPTEADYYHRHGRWPHKLYDPKERRAV